MTNPTNTELCPEQMSAIKSDVTGAVADLFLHEFPEQLTQRVFTWFEFYLEYNLTPELTDEQIADIMANVRAMKRINLFFGEAQRSMPNPWPYCTETYQASIQG